MRKIVYAILFISLFVLKIDGQEINKSRLDSLFGLIEASDRGMGSVSIFKDGEEVYRNSTGFAEIENQLKADENTKYRIGSISKTFTAAIIMQMIEEGRLNLDTRLSVFFDDIPNSEKISIEQMLRHRSGLVNFTDMPDYKEWMESSQRKKQLLKKIKKNGVDFEPGEKMSYSNTNYVLLSYIAEKIDNKDFSQILKDRILIPCGLQNTAYGGKIDPENNEAKSYQKHDEWMLSTETDMSIPAGAGAFISTPTDLNKFYTCLFNHQIVSDSSLSKMTHLVDDTGIGLFRFPFFDKAAYGHSGGIDGFQSVTAYFPDEKVSVAYVSNGVVMARNNILIAVLSLYFERNYTFPEFNEGITLHSDDLDQYTGVYKNESLPMKITFTKDGNTLIAQASNQPSFPLESYEKHKFKFEPAGMKIEFKPEEVKLILYQSGMEIEFTKE